ncbi:LamG-like jellyroll fold domain-containing protein [Streptomyces sp. NPDC101158]|uniref:LamG-like jellyroll fold domain-containing protein n=1 Tax=Streptomyces sp. NPDC101158 TaxID=3366117 RepID=UPI00381788C1
MMRTRSRPWLRAGALLASLTSVGSLLGLAAAPPATASGAALSDANRIGTQQILFRSGTAGYGCFRIPTLVRTKPGTLLAFAEARTSPSCADRGPIDTVVRRSTNDGRTWGPIRVVLSGSETDREAPYVRGNASPIADLRTGDVFLLSNSEKAVPTNGEYRKSWVQKSSDDGLSWGAPQPAPRLTTNGTGWFGTGPSHGIQLQEGPHAGRLLVGAYERPSGTDARVGILYSDDHGATWQRSSTVNSYAEDAGGNPTAKPGEPAVAELPGGEVYISARSPYPAGHRMHTVSADGGATVPKLGLTAGWTGPDVNGAVLAPARTYRQTPGDLLLMSAPAHPANRQEMRIRYSTDKGATWTNAPGGLVSTAATDRAGYSDLAELSEGEFGLLYEGGPGFSAENIHFNRFRAADLQLPASVTHQGSALPQPTPAAGRTTPDTTAEANDGYLSTGAALGSGAVYPPTGPSASFGQGLVLDGVDGRADLPYTPSLDPGAGDVTYSLFFRYDATTSTPQQALFWAYGVGSAKPQVWVRVQPGQNRILAWVQGTGGTATAGLAGPDPARPAFGDGQWHHLTLVRSGGTVTLDVDGRTGVQQGQVSGALSGPRTDATGIGIRVGDKPVEDPPGGPADGFTGVLDEFRLYKAALPDDQRALLRGAGAAGVAADRLAAHLPFQVVDTADPAALRTTRVQDDVSGHCADGTLLGTTSSESAVTAGRIGSGALAVDAGLPGVEVPFVPALDNGTGDFTFALWFRYAATSATKDSALMWAYGSTSGKPSLWVRAKPGLDKLTVRAETAGGAVETDLPDPQQAGETDRRAFGDNRWHLLTLTRTAGQAPGSRLTMGVDGSDAGAAGAHVVTADGLTGSFTDGVVNPEGFRIGSKPTGTDVLTGELDDFRYYRRALSTADVADILDTPAGGWAAPKDPDLWWSMEPGNTEQHLVTRPVDDATTRATPDAGAHCGHAYVRGGATPTSTGAKYGRALPLDGVDDAVELPYGDAKALGAGDFTLSTWVRFTSADNTTPVLAWAYGVGSGERQLWIRAVPAQNKVTALLQTDAATTTLDVVAPQGTVFGDDTWRLVVLRRQGGSLTLAVDGTAATKQAPAGSVTYDDGFDVRGFLLGARPDGGTVDRLHGSLDEFRLVRRALSDTELTALRSADTPVPADPGTAVRLAFDTVTAQGAYARM